LESGGIALNLQRNDFAKQELGSKESKVPGTLRWIDPEDGSHFVERKLGKASQPKIVRLPKGDLAGKSYELNKEATFDCSARLKKGVKKTFGLS
jgi:hypothetical protein